MQKMKDSKKPGKYVLGDNDSDDDLDPQRIQRLKEKTTQVFDQMNKLNRNDFKKDTLDGIQLGDEFNRLALRDLNIYKRMLLNRLSQVPYQWYDQGKELTDASNLTSKGQFSLFNERELHSLPLDIVKNVQRVIHELKQGIAVQAYIQERYLEHKEQASKPKVVLDDILKSNRMQKESSRQRVDSSRRKSSKGGRRSKVHHRDDLRRSDLRKSMTSRKSTKGDGDYTERVDYMLPSGEFDYENATRDAISDTQLRIRLENSDLGDLSKMLESLKQFLWQKELFRACIFELNKSPLTCGYLRFLPNDLSFLSFQIKDNSSEQFNLVGNDEASPGKAPAQSTAPSSKKDPEFAGLEQEETGRDEFYDCYEMYQQNGVNAQISLTPTLLEAVKPADITNNHLAQKNLIDDDFLVLKTENFERLFIFNREEHFSTRNEDIDKNFNKRLFLKVFHVLMTIVVHIDKEVQGHFGIVKPSRRPQEIYFQGDDEDGLFKDQRTFKLKNAYVSVEQETIEKIKESMHDESLTQKNKNFPFDCHQIRFCDLSRQQVFINLILQDMYVLKSHHISILLEHRPHFTSITAHNKRLVLAAANTAKGPIGGRHILQKSLSDRNHFPDTLSNLIDSLDSGLDHVRQAELDMHQTIFLRLRLSHVESQLVSIINCRKRVFEAIMSKLHFHALKRGAGKNFKKWVTKRYEKLSDITKFVSSDAALEEHEKNMDYKGFAENLSKKISELQVKVHKAVQKSIQYSQHPPKPQNKKSRQSNASSSLTGTSFGHHNRRNSTQHPQMSNQAIEMIEAQIGWYRAQEAHIRAQSEKEALEPFLALKNVYKDTVNVAGAKKARNEAKSELITMRQDLLVEKEVHERELEELYKSTRRRIQMKTNLKQSPILDTFDLLDLQEISLRCKKINKKSKVKHRRCIETNEVRRAGKQSMKAKREYRELLGQVIVPIKANLLDTDAVFDDIRSRNQKLMKQTTLAVQTVSGLQRSKLKQELDSVLILDFYRDQLVHLNRVDEKNGRVNLRRLRDLIGKTTIYELKDWFKVKGMYAIAQKQNKYEKLLSLVPQSMIMAKSVQVAARKTKSDLIKMATLTGDDLEDPAEINKLKSMKTVNSNTSEQLLDNIKKPLILQLANRIDRFHQELSKKFPPTMAETGTDQHELDLWYKAFQLMMEDQVRAGRDKSDNAIRGYHINRAFGRGKQINWDPISRHDYIVLKKKRTLQLTQEKSRDERRNERARVMWLELGEHMVQDDSITEDSLGEAKTHAKITGSTDRMTTGRMTTPVDRHSARRLEQYVKRQPSGGYGQLTLGELSTQNYVKKKIQVKKSPHDEGRATHKSGMASQRETAGFEYTIGGDQVMGQLIHFDSFGAISEATESEHTLGSDDSKEATQRDKLQRQQTKKTMGTQMTTIGKNRDQQNISDSDDDSLDDQDEYNSDKRRSTLNNKMLENAEAIFVNYQNNNKAQEGKVVIRAQVGSSLYGDGIRGKKHKMFDLINENFESEAIDKMLLVGNRHDLTSPSSKKRSSENRRRQYKNQPMMTTYEKEKSILTPAYNNQSSMMHTNKQSMLLDTDSLQNPPTTYQGTGRHSKARQSRTASEKRQRKIDRDYKKVEKNGGKNEEGGACDCFSFSGGDGNGNSGCRIM